MDEGWKIPSRVILEDMTVYVPVNHAGGPLASTQPQSAHSSHATTPRSARPGTMGSLLDVPASGFGAIGQPAAPKYPSQGSLDGEFTGYVKPNPGAHAPIGRGSKTSQVTSCP